jgi:hypothetical protein
MQDLGAVTPPSHQEMRRRLAKAKGHLRDLRWHLRRRRHRALSAALSAAPKPVKILDVGGAPYFWETVELPPEFDLTLLNREEALAKRPPRPSAFTNYTTLVGDARDLHAIPDKSFDFVICNSVLEHVGRWEEMCAAAAELERVAHHGWVQVPAIECPIEPHLVLPMVHWFNRPLQRRIVETVYRIPPHEARKLIDGLNLVSRREMRLLFPLADIRTELLLTPKSHLAIW